MLSKCPILAGNFGLRFNVPFFAVTLAIKVPNRILDFDSEYFLLVFLYTRIELIKCYPFTILHSSLSFFDRFQIIYSSSLRALLGVN